MDLPDSDSLSRVESYSGAGSDPLAFHILDFHHLWSPIPELFCWATWILNAGPTTPGRNSPWFRLFRFRSPLLTESRFLSFPPVTEMFQLAGLASRTYGFSTGSFGYPGINARVTATPGFSQSSTPFFAFWRQDIPHTPLVA
jgi:hypothetical protein